MLHQVSNQTHHLALGRASSMIFANDTTLNPYRIDSSPTTIASSQSSSTSPSLILDMSQIESSFILVDNNSVDYNQNRTDRLWLNNGSILDHRHSQYNLDEKHRKHNSNNGINLLEKIDSNRNEISMPIIQIESNLKNQKENSTLTLLRCDPSSSLVIGDFLKNSNQIENEKSQRSSSVRMNPSESICSSISSSKSSCGLTTTFKIPINFTTTVDFSNQTSQMDKTAVELFGTADTIMVDATGTDCPKTNACLMNGSIFSTTNVGRIDSLIANDYEKCDQKDCHKNLTNVSTASTIATQQSDRANKNDVVMTINEIGMNSLNNYENCHFNLGKCFFFFHNVSVLFLI